MGLDISEIADSLRISGHYLAAIEQGRFGDLPGRIYAIGFLRSYAEFLGGDGDVCISLFKAELGQDGHSRKLVFVNPPSETRWPSLLMLSASLLLAAIAYSGWYALQSDEASRAEMVTEVPSRLLSLTQTLPSAESAMVTALGSANAAEPSAAPPITQTAQDTAPVASVAGAAVSRPEQADTVAALTPPTQAGPESSTALAATPIAGLAGRRAGVLVRAIRPVHVAVKDQYGLTVTPRRALQAGELYSPPGSVGIVLEADDLSAVQLIVDGKLVGRGDRLATPGQPLALNEQYLKSLVD